MKIYTYPDPILRIKSGIIENIDGNTQILVDKMAKTMYSAPGIGLAAVQIGQPVRLIVYDLAEWHDDKKPSVLINPEIIMAEGELVHEEACLSVLDFSAEVKRSAKIKVRGVDRNGDPVDIEAEGLLAVCLQHEIDHLNGVLFIDHISSLKRALYKKRLKKDLKK
ncbi:MAG TPA: peptide deformylase [Desulfatiglandales bacterium]|nr:peptide deformylase [Desulfatiglandales bacterium]